MTAHRQQILPLAEYSPPQGDFLMLKFLYKLSVTFCSFEASGLLSKYFFSANHRFQMRSRGSGSYPEYPKVLAST